MIGRRIKKIVIVAVIALFFNGDFARADVWGANTASVVMHEAWLTVQEKIKNTLVAQIKVRATALINNQIRALITGSSSSGPMYIASYEDFIYANARKEGLVVTGDFFKSLNTGVSSETREMLRGTEAAIRNEINGITGKSNIDSYVSGGVSEMFNQTKGGGQQAFMAAISNPYNNPYGAYLMSSSNIESQIKKKEDAARIEAIAGQGFKSKRNEQNLISLPGSMVSRMSADSETLPLQMIAGATSVEEVTSILTTVALNSTIEYGLSKVTNSPAMNVAGRINSGYSGGLRGLQSTIYGNSSNTATNSTGVFNPQSVPLSQEVLNNVPWMTNK